MITQSISGNWTLIRSLGLSWLALAATVVNGQSVLTWHNDNARTGQNLQETTLTPANVNSTTFGRLFTLAVDGKVDAQPLYVPAVTIPNQGVHNVLYVVTEHDSVYAFDADSGALLKQASMLGNNEVPSDSRSCGQVVPEIGITGTPAIDLTKGPHGSMYLVAMSKDASGNYHHRIHSLDLTTLTDQVAAVEIAATFAGAGAENTFVPAVHKARPGLLIGNGVVYTTWGSHCDAGSYVGWVIGYDESSLARVNVLNVAPNGNDAGIWNAGAGPAMDGAGNIYLMTGNGTFDTTLTPGGFPNKNDYGNAFMKIAGGAGTLTVSDYFTMSNTTSESNADTDLGSGGLILLPPLNDAQGQPHSLAVGAGKDTDIYIVDQGNMGKFHTGSNAIYQLLPGALPSGSFATPAWFNGKLYFGGVSDTLRAFSFSGGAFAATPSSHSMNSFPYPGATPSISANGTSNAILWAAENSSVAVLHAYDATDLSKELYNSNQAANSRDHFGSGNKYIVPTVVNGKVYVGTTSGVGVFGLLSAPPDFSLSMSPGSQTVAAGGSTSYTVMATANNGFSGAINFGASGLPSGATPSFNPPSVPGSGSTTLTINTSAGATVGSTTITVTGTSGSLNHNTSATLSITGSAAPPTTVSVSPSSGSGSAQTFTFTFTDPAGGANIVSTQLVVGATLSTSGTCYMYYARAANAIYLASDSGTFGPSASLGSAGTLQNSQCSLDAGASSVMVSGNTLTMNLALSFKAAFTGAKNVYMEAQNASLDSGWAQRGTWTVTNSGPTPDFSLNLAPGSQTVAAGGNTSYTVTATASNGFGGVVSFGVSGLPSGASGSFNPPSVTGSGSSTLTIGTTSGTPVGGSTVTVTGTSGALVHNASASLNVTGSGAPAPPTTVSVSPSSGSGSTQTFAFTFSDPNGGANIVSTQLDIGATLSTAGVCYFYYARAANAIYLANDSGAFGPSLALGSAGTMQNSQCVLDTGASSAMLAGNTLTMNLAISFKPAFAGAKNVYMEAQNASLDSGWALRGTWTVGNSGAPSPPSLVSVTPSSGSGSAQTFAFTFSDANGGANIVSTQLDIGATLSTSGTCYFYYARAANAIYLASDSGAFGPSLALGSAGTMQNSQCALDAGASSVMLSGNSLTLNLALSFKPAFAGAKNVYMEAQNSSLDSGWAQRGTWTVGSGGAPAPPTTVSVSPSSGSGSTQAFTFTFTDPAGGANIVSTQLNFGATLATAGVCYFYYARAANAIYLANDSGGFGPSLALGTAGTMQNSQCSLDAGASSVMLSGNTLTMNLALSFKPAFAGPKNVYMEAQNASLDSGWALRGTWTAP